MRFFVMVILSVCLYANDTSQWVTKEHCDSLFKVHSSWQNSPPHVYKIDDSNYIDFRCLTTNGNIEQEITKIENNVFATQVYSKIQQKPERRNHLSGTTVLYKVASQFYHLFVCVFEQKLYSVMYCYTNDLYAQVLQNSARSFTIKKATPLTVEDHHENFAIKYQISPQWQKEILVDSAQIKNVLYRISTFFSLHAYMEILPREIPLHLAIEKIQRIFFPHHVYARITRKSQASIPGKQFFYIIRDRSFPLRYQYADIFFCVRGQRIFAMAYFYKEKSTHLEQVLPSLTLENKTYITQDDTDDTTKNTSPQESTTVLDNAEQTAKTYFAHVTSAKIFIQKPNGKKWDFGWGKTTEPDAFTTIKEFGNDKVYTTSVVRNSFEPIWNYATPIVVKKGQVLVISVYDKDSQKNDHVGTIMITIKENDIKQGYRDIQFNSVEKLTLTFSTE